jgi:hypothetical protein
MLGGDLYRPTAVVSAYGFNTVFNVYVYSPAQKMGTIIMSLAYFPYFENRVGL